MLALPQAHAYLAFLHTQRSPVQGMVPPTVGLALAYLLSIKTILHRQAHRLN